MASSIFEMHGVSTLLSWTALACAGLASLILGWFLVRRPALSTTIKVLLFFAIGVLPIGSAVTGNVVGFQKTMDREFCGSCHTMTPYTDDASDLTSTSLASMHTRNREFGTHSCYTCHADYGMFGTISTKIGSLSHVYRYYTEYRSMSAQAAFGRIQLYKPYANDTCMQCHSTEVTSWSAVAEHASARDLLRTGELSCLGVGCHGPAHPFSKAQPAPEGSP